jgi:hypothetical protein
MANATPSVKEPKGMIECNLIDLLFDVENRENPMPSNKEYSRQIVGQINGGDFLLNACSDVYELAKNEEIFPKIEQLLRESEIEYEVSYFHVNNVRFYANLIITDKRYAYNMSGTNDTINPMLIVQHSYNGKTMYGIKFGYFRLVCTNGATISVEEMKEFGLSIGGKHTISIKSSLEALTGMLMKFVDNAAEITGKITAKYEKLRKNVPVVIEDRIEAALKAADIVQVENNKKSTMQYILSIATYEANLVGLGYNGIVNDWLIYNAINQYINDDNMNIKLPEKRQEIDSKVLEFLLKD